MSTEANRQAVLEAYSHDMADHSYTRVSMAMVARTAGMTLGYRMRRPDVQRCFVGGGPVKW